MAVDNFYGAADPAAIRGSATGYWRLPSSMAALPGGFLASMPGARAGAHEQAQLDMAGSAVCHYRRFDDG
jgi:hypothetical protein